MKVFKYSKHNIEKLPKWAQQYICKLESDIAFWKRAHEQIASGGDAMISWNLLREPAHGIPDRAHVRFQLETGFINVNVKDGILLLRHNRNMTITPVASNAVDIF